jgi:hypothetical protein
VATVPFISQGSIFGRGEQHTLLGNRYLGPLLVIMNLFWNPDMIDIFVSYKYAILIPFKKINFTPDHQIVFV